MSQFLIPNDYDRNLPRTVCCKLCKRVFHLKKHQLHFHCGTMVMVLTTIPKCIVKGCNTQAMRTVVEDSDYCNHHYSTKEKERSS